MHEIVTTLCKREDKCSRYWQALIHSENGRIYTRTRRWTVMDGKPSTSILSKLREVKAENAHARATEYLRKMAARYRRSGYERIIRATQQAVHPMLPREYDARRHTISFPAYAYGITEEPRVVVRQGSAFKNGQAVSTPFVFPSLEIDFEGSFIMEDGQPVFLIYDVLTQGLSPQARFSLIANQLIPALADLPVRFTVPAVVNSIAELDAFYGNATYPVVCVQTQWSEYTAGQTNDQFYTYVPKQTLLVDEFMIMDVFSGYGTEKDLAVLMCITADGRRFNVKPKADKNERKRILIEKNKYIGQMAEVHFTKYTDRGYPLYPVVVGFKEAVMQET